MAKSKLRSVLGIIIITLGIISPVFVIAVPMLDLDSTQSGAVTAFLLVGAPEIGLILGGILAGKEGVLLMKNKLLGLFGLTSKGAVTRARYFLAVYLLVGWILLSAILSYVIAIEGLPFVQDYGRWVFFVADAILIVAVFFIGGDPLIKRLAAIFSWEGDRDTDEVA